MGLFDVLAINRSARRNSMHELSIVESVVEAVTETAARYPGARVNSVKLRVGVLSAVVKESLEFCWELATVGTPLAEAALVVKTVPIVVHCAACGRDAEIEGVQSLRCPNCGELTADLRQGRELEIESIEIEEPGPKEPEVCAPDKVEEKL